MTLLSLVFAPMIDPPGALTAALNLSPSQLGLVLLSGVGAFCASWSATLVLGLISALARDISSSAPPGATLPWASASLSRARANRSEWVAAPR